MIHIAEVVFIFSSCQRIFWLNVAYASSWIEFEIETNASVTSLNITPKQRLNYFFMTWPVYDSMKKDILD